MDEENLLGRNDYVEHWLRRYIIIYLKVQEVDSGRDEQMKQENCVKSQIFR